MTAVIQVDGLIAPRRAGGRRRDQPDGPPGRGVRLPRPQWSGKTTTLRVLLGLVFATAGQGQRPRSASRIARGAGGHRIVRRGAHVLPLPLGSGEPGRPRDIRRDAQGESRSGSADCGPGRAGPGPLLVLLPRHETASRGRGCAAEGPGAGGPRRADQRTRPAGMRDMRALVRSLGAEGRTVLCPATSWVRCSRSATGSASSTRAGWWPRAPWLSCGRKRAWSARRVGHRPFQPRGARGRAGPRRRWPTAGAGRRAAPPLSPARW